MPSSQKFGQGATAHIGTKNISNLSNDVFTKFESKVIAPRNPKLIRTTELPKTRVSCKTYRIYSSITRKIFYQNINPKSGACYIQGLN